MRRDSAITWRRFREIIEARRGIVIEPEYLGSKKPHQVVCAQGHETRQRPGDVVSKGAGCIICTGNDQATAWRTFCQQVAAQGGQVLEPAPLGGNKPHRVLCPEGHESVAIPSSVRRGLGVCRTCSPVSTIRAEQEFRDLVAALGGSITEPSWLGNRTPHRIVCAKGHGSTPRPADARQTGSICRVCAGHCSETCWREFRTRVADLGGTVIEPEWLGNKKAHRIICREGHKTTVRPNNVEQGSGICRYCKCKVWDIFYVVTNEDAQAVKFGVTSHDSRARLQFHRADGFGSVVRTFTSLPDAAELERAVLAALKLAAIKPVRGREYFDIAALPVILDIADNWPALLGAAAA